MDPKKAADKLLADAGFVDIETADGMYLKRASKSSFASDPNADRLMSRAQQWLYEYRFESDEHRQVWALYADGLPYREIALAMGWPGTNKRRVFNIVDPIRREMLSFGRPKRGRPYEPDGRGVDSVILSTRLDRREANALFMLADGCGETIGETARRAFLLVATMVLQNKLDLSALNSMRPPSNRQEKE